MKDGFEFHFVRLFSGDLLLVSMLVALQIDRDEHPSSPPS